MAQITMSPMRQEIKLKAGETYQGSVRIANPADSETDLNYRVAAKPFSVVGPNYDLDFATTSNRTLIADWISFEETSGTLAPNEVRTLNFTIRVPADAPAGGQYAAIAVGEDRNMTIANNSIGINETVEIMSVIYAAIEGETRHEGEVLVNDLPGFSTSTPLVSEVTATNTGNVHEVITTDITVYDAISSQKIFPNLDEGNYQNTDYIMPDATRTIYRTLDMFSNLGVYDVSIEVEYLGEKSVLNQRVIICPLWFLVLAGMFLGAVVALVIRIFVRRRRRK